MTTITLNTDKFNHFSLSTQVQEILKERGYSKFFNYSDFQYFKKQVKDEFNKAQAIADLFIQENESELSDFHDYVF